MERMARGPSLLGIDTRKDLGVATTPITAT
jgi:hypothetical protein